MAPSIRSLCALELVFAIVCALSGASVAHADTYRVPATGSPALVVADPPDTWRVWINSQGAIVVGAKDGSDLVQIMLVGDPTLATKTNSDIAADLFKGVGAPPPSRSEPGSIGDAGGQAFVGAATVSGASVGVRLTVVRLVTPRVVLLFETAREPLTPAQTAARKDLVARIRIIR